MTAESNRTLRWHGLVNGRDLAGIATTHGSIGRGRLVRSASVHTLTSTGWQELVDYGIRTIVDLRHGWEIDEAPIPEDRCRTEVDRLHVPLEPPGYIESWSDREDRWKLSTPLYFHEFMANHAERVGAVLRAICSAPPGGVLLHCHGGKDRAGLTVAMLLDLLGADHESIVSDHWMSFDRPRSIEVELGKEESPGKPQPNRDDYARIMHGLLSEYPARSCFADGASAESARLKLADRLCGVR